jgi:hypothetical protein
MLRLQRTPKALRSWYMLSPTMCYPLPVCFPAAGALQWQCALLTSYLKTVFACLLFLLFVRTFVGQHPDAELRFSRGSVVAERALNELTVDGHMVVDGSLTVAGELFTNGDSLVRESGRLDRPAVLAPRPSSLPRPALVIDGC